MSGKNLLVKRFRLSSLIDNAIVKERLFDPSRDRHGAVALKMTILIRAIAAPAVMAPTE